MDALFALCLTPHNGRVLAFGAVSNEILAEPMMWFPLAVPQISYIVPVSSTMYSADSPFEMNASTALVDSGTTLLNLREATAYEIERRMEQNLCNAIGDCRENWIHAPGCYAEEVFPLEHLPTLKFELVGDQNMMLELEPQVYILVDTVANSETLRCVGFEGTQDQLIFGAVVLSKYATAYDLLGGRVGFATAASGCRSSTPVVETCACSMAVGTCLVEVIAGLCGEEGCVRMYCDRGGELTCEVQKKEDLQKCDGESSGDVDSAYMCCARENGTVVVQTS